MSLCAEYRSAILVSKCQILTACVWTVSFKGANMSEKSLNRVLLRERSMFFMVFSEMDCSVAGNISIDIPGCMFCRDT